VRGSLDTHSDNVQRRKRERYTALKPINKMTDRKKQKEWTKQSKIKKCKMGENEIGGSKHQEMKKDL
jgi:hypothetical protein